MENTLEAVDEMFTVGGQIVDKSQLCTLMHNLFTFCTHLHILKFENYQDINRVIHISTGPITITKFLK